MSDYDQDPMMTQENPHLSGWEPFPEDPPTVSSSQTAPLQAEQPVYPLAEPARPRTKTRKRGFWGCLQTTAAVSAMALTALLGTGIVLGLVIYSSLSDELASDMQKLQSMEGVEDFQVTRIYDRDGNLLYEVFDEGRRAEVTLDEIPYAVRWATIATEDDTFYENPGFDPASIARAAWEWWEEGEIVSGGSTITQQLVRQIVFDYEERTEQTLRRKIKEAALAWVMTQQLSKDRILEIYLNEIPYGNMTYGIEAAANVYFGKHATDLTLAEASFLAGLPQSPYLYDPYTSFEVAKARQLQVLDLMVLHGYLTQVEADVAYREPPGTVDDLESPDISLEAPHFTVEARRQVAGLPGIDPLLLSRGGLEIYTTLDPGYQALAEQIAADHVAAVRDEFNMGNAALVAINPNTGEVLAMLGSVDYDDMSIDGNVNVILSLQQPGSTMKALTYALAFEQGQTPASIIWDVPMAYDTGRGEGFDYEPRNYDGRFHGPMRLRDALANSYNIPAVTVTRDVGVPELLAFANRLGIESLAPDPSLYGLSITLGGGEVTPLEMATAYAVFANEGKQVAPYLIARVTDRQGTVLYEAPQPPTEEVLDPRIAFTISSILSDNDARTPAMGADSPLKLSFPAAVKTGTTNDYRDNWTIGYTPHLTVAVWTGNTDNTEMAAGTSGLTGAAPIWHDYMEAIYADAGLTDLLVPDEPLPLRSDFPPPPGMEQRQVCHILGWKDPRLAEEGCSRTRLEWFILREPGEEAPTSTPTDQPTPTPEPTFPPLPGDPPPLPGPGEEGGPPDVPLVEPQFVELEPGIMAMTIVRLPEEIRGALLIAPVSDALPEGTPRPDAPIYCEVRQPYPASEQVATQLFIAAPADPIDAIRARNWAIEQGIPIVPGLDCADEVLNGLDPLQPQIDYDEASGATYRIDSPVAGQEVYGVIPVLGTAAFDPARILYYKVELGFGPNPDQWVTLGDIHTESVSSDTLEYLHADALPPGEYVLRLVLVRSDGNLLPPFLVPIRITATPPEATP